MCDSVLCVLHVVFHSCVCVRVCVVVRYVIVIKLVMHSRYHKSSVMCVNQIVSVRQGRM
jgi:hypothetical protein